MSVDIDVMGQSWTIHRNQEWKDSGDDDGHLANNSRQTREETINLVWPMRI